METTKRQDTGQDNMADEAILPTILAPPAVTALRDVATVRDKHRSQLVMERTVSMDIREEREDLKKAAEQSLNAILDLNFDGTIRWISPSWQQLTGTSPDAITGRPIADVIYDNKTIFSDTVASLKSDDSKSRIIRFAVKYTARQDDGLVNEQEDGSVSKESGVEEHLINLEAQGIMVYDRSTGVESHVSILAHIL